MTDANAPDDRLRDERNVWLATTRSDGRPHVTPVWFVYLRSRFWVGAGRDAVKVRNLRSNERVSLALEDGDTPIVAEGVAQVHPQERPADVAAAFLAKYGWNITVAEDPDIGTVVLIEIEPRRWLFEHPVATL